MKDIPATTRLSTKAVGLISSGKNENKAMRAKYPLAPP